MDGSGGQAGRDYYYEYIAIEKTNARRTRLENNIAELLGNEARYVQKLSLLPAIVDNYQDQSSFIFRLLREMTGIIRRVLGLHRWYSSFLHTHRVHIEINS